MAFIEMQQVTYSYPVQAKQQSGETVMKTLPALDGVSLEIQAGEYVVILGHNGSGKSTLARLCNALLIPESGYVFVDGLDTRD